MTYRGSSSSGQLTAVFEITAAGCGVPAPLMAMPSTSRVMAMVPVLKVMVPFLAAVHEPTVMAVLGSVIVSALFCTSLELEMAIPWPAALTVAVLASVALISSVFSVPEIAVAPLTALDLEGERC